MSPVAEAEERLRQAERDRDIARAVAAEAVRMLDDAQRLRLRRILSGSEDLVDTCLLAS
jgi:hypothetical protein